MAKILYVDDDVANLVVFEALCEGRFETCTADSGQQALELLASEEIGVLLADQRMPGMTGVELAERAAAEHPDVVRILVTAFSDLSEAIDAINRGNIRGYLRKPWDQDELLATLKEALGTYGMRKRVRELELHMLATERVYTLGVVTAGIAHELKSPLQMMNDAASVVRSRLRDAVGLLDAGEYEEAKSLIRVLSPFLEAQQGATESMLEICRGFEASNYVPTPDEQCDLGEVLSTASRIALASRKGGAQLELDVKTNALVAGNRHRLGRVLINLLVNAFDALDGKEGGKVVVRLFDSTGTSDFAKAHVVAEVEDNGAGIAAADMSRIFDIFYSTKLRSGTGLGLAMSKEIVDELGGRLECDSELGRGSLFRLRLPMAN